MTYVGQFDVAPATILEEASPVSREIIRLADLKSQISDLETEAKFVTERIVKELDTAGIEAAIATAPDGSEVRASVVRSATKEVNLAELTRVDPALAERITTRKVDTKQLDKAINMGLFSNPQAAATVSFKERSPYVRITAVEDSHE